MRTTKFGYALLGAFGALVLACGGDDGGAETKSVAIRAEDGGTISIGSATLTIPPDSLLEDVTIIVTRDEPRGLPDIESLSGDSFEFKPEDTEFAEPASLSLPKTEEPPSGLGAVVAQLGEDGDELEDLVSVVTDDSVTASIRRLGTFVVRFSPVATTTCGGEICGQGETCVNGTCVGEGQLQFTMQWSAFTDMDLHVLTPNGTHIYFANPTGDSGSLDVDNTAGGPDSVENIFFTAPPTGDYQYWVDRGVGDFTLSVSKRGVLEATESGTLVSGEESTHFTVSYP